MECFGKRSERNRAVGKDNAAVTILPAKNNAVKILIESEDHKTQNTFVINLGVADPADDSKDYTGVITPSAGSTQPNNGTDIGKAFDKKNDTFWHSSWNPSTTNENLYVTMELAEAQKIDAIRYLPKGGNLTWRRSERSCEDIYCRSKHDRC